VTDCGERGARRFDEGRMCGPARQRFDSECAAAGVEIEHLHVSSGAEYVEQRLLGPVRHRTRFQTARRAQVASSQPASDDTHASVVTRKSSD
jgi:hypothetical protein